MSVNALKFFYGCKFSNLNEGYICEITKLVTYPCAKRCRFSGYRVMDERTDGPIKYMGFLSNEIKCCLRFTY